MADISKEIQDFREAVYGEEVRGSMISLAEKVNAESEDSAKKVTEYGKAEASRAQAETARVNAEEARVTAEKGRVSAEKTRVSAESTRADNEDGRIAAEDGRADAEAERVTAETERASAETSRVSAETKRASAETKRINAEKARATAEEERASEETGRVNAESARVTAETNRQKNTAQAIEDCDNAATRANAAAEAAEGIVDGTGLVTVQEKGAANGVATLDENTKIPQSQIDGNNIPITFETAIERANIQSGDTLAVAFGKLSKFCADLQPHAFAAPVNNLTGTDASLPLAAPQGKVLKAEIDELNSTLDWKVAGDVTGTDVITLNTWKELSVFIIGSDSNYYSLHFTRNMVISTGRRFRTGYYFSSNKYAGLELSIGSGGVRIAELFENGINKTSSARLLVWYK